MPDDAKILTIGVPKETQPGERRVAITAETAQLLMKNGLTVIVETGAGQEAGFLDESFRSKGVQIAAERREVFSKADIILQVNGYGANPDAGKADLELMHSGQIIIGMMEPLSAPKLAQQLEQTQVTVFAMELMPRITRAQSMDVLSSMASIAGYKAVILAAEHLPKIFPMMMTAAGTIASAKVFIVGVGVAGLQAIATARRLGALVKAYDVRPAVKEQVKSLGADFVELQIETSGSEAAGGYAKEMNEEFYTKQRAMMKKVVAESDVVITTAAIPGKKAPILITTDMVTGMAPGSVIVDLAAERGGNCEFTQPGEIINFSGLTVIGSLNLPSTAPYHSSQMYAKNISSFLLNMVKDGQIQIDLEDEITRETLVAKDGAIYNSRIKELLGS